jgi:Photosynthetic reaction centre cytochrome C subunit
MRIVFVLIFITVTVGITSVAVSHNRNISYPLLPTIEDSLEADRLKYMNIVMNSIKGKEKMPADKVFKNLKVIKGRSNVSAEHFLWMMNWGWSAELGVTCSHCHSVYNWESDSLKTKDIARGMWLMRVKINDKLLPAITGKEYQNAPAVTCITCHRGKPVPDAN